MEVQDERKIVVGAVLERGDVTAAVVQSIDDGARGSGRDRASLVDRDGRVVDTGHLPASRRQPQRVAALTAGQVQCLAVGEGRRVFHQKLVRGSAPDKFGSFVFLVPVRRVHKQRR
ncbi:hypothetical protein D9M69_721820 [compost metagenome]